jgi:hypothetical protein
MPKHPEIFKAKLEQLAKPEFRVEHLSFKGEDLDDQDLALVLKIFAADVKKAESLTSLNLANNKLCHLPQDFLRIFPHLVTLNLANNKIKIGPDLGYCRSLSKFDISGNPLQLPPQGLHTLQNFTLTPMAYLGNFKLKVPDNPVGILALKQAFADKINSQRTVNGQNSESLITVVNIHFTDIDGVIVSFSIAPNPQHSISPELFEEDFKVKAYYADLAAANNLNTNRKVYLTAYGCIALRSKQATQSKEQVPAVVIQKILDYANKMPRAAVTLEKHNATLMKLFGANLPAFTEFQTGYPNKLQKIRDTDNQRLLTFAAKTDLAVQDKIDALAKTAQPANSVGVTAKTESQPEVDTKNSAPNRAIALFF